MAEQKKSPVMAMVALGLGFVSALMLGGLYVTDYFAGVWPVEFAIGMTVGIGAITIGIYTYILGDGWREVIKDFKALFSKEEDKKQEEEKNNWQKILGYIASLITAVFMAYLVYAGFVGFFADNNLTGLWFEYVLPIIAGFVSLVGEAIFYIKFIANNGDDCNDEATFKFKDDNELELQEIEPTEMELSPMQQAIRAAAIAFSVIGGVGLFVAVALAVLEISFLPDEVKYALIGLGVFPLITFCWQSFNATKDWIDDIFKIHSQMNELDIDGKFYFHAKNAFKVLCSCVPAVAEGLFIALAIVLFSHDVWNIGYEISIPIAAFLGACNLFSNFSEEHGALLDSRTFEMKSYTAENEQPSEQDNAPLINSKYNNKQLLDEIWDAKLYSDNRKLKAKI